MDYNELLQKVKTLEDDQKRIERSAWDKIRRRDKKILNLNLQYIAEHQPLPLKRFQRIKVVARVTEESRKTLGEEARQKKKYALGTTYTIIGVHNGYAIDKRGQVVPSFYGKEGYRCPYYDEVLSVELTPDQPEGNCNKCLRAKDERCYMMGGKSFGPSCAVWKIDEEGMVPCPNYEEVVEGGLYAIKGRVYPARYYPKVTMTRTKDGQRKYRLYEGNWAYYTEWEAEYIEKYYTHEPQDYGGEKEVRVYEHQTE